MLLAFDSLVRILLCYGWAEVEEGDTRGLNTVGMLEKAKVTQWFPSHHDYCEVAKVMPLPLLAAQDVQTNVAHE